MISSASDGLSGLLQWSAPVIFRPLARCLRWRLNEASASWRLARLHSRVWRALISGEMGNFDGLRSELVGELTAVGLSLDDLAEADAQTMSELLEIVIARFRRSPRLSHGYHLALIQLASRLALRGLKRRDGRGAARHFITDSSLKPRALRNCR